MFEFLSSYVPILTSFTVLFSIYLITALSLNMEYGYGGIPNFGHVFFVSVGAYMAGVLTARVVDYIAGIKAGYCSGQSSMLRTEYLSNHPLEAIGLFIAALILGATVGGLFGYASSYPALRLKEDFLAITLIFIGDMGRIVARNEEGIVCALTGLTGIANPLSFIKDVGMRSLSYTFVVVAFAILVYLYVQRLAKSPFGRLLKAIRDDDLAAMSLGKIVPRVRGEIMIIGSAIAAIAGVLRTFYIQGVVADDFQPIITFLVLTMVILGGMANNKGVIVGTFIMTSLDQFISPSFLSMLGVAVRFDITYVKYIIIGLIIILILMFRPQGAIPEGPVETPMLELSRSSEWDLEEKLEMRGNGSKSEGVQNEVKK